MFQTRRHVAAAALLAAFAVPAAAQAKRLPLKEALARHTECLDREALFHHVDGRDTLAQTGAPEALAVLIEDFRKVRDNQEYSRYVLASLLGRYFRDEELMPQLAALRADFAKPEHAWLWKQTLQREIDATKNDDQAIAIACQHKVYALRAAAIAALGDSDRGEIKGAIIANCTEFPRKEADRMVLLGAMTGALYSQKQRVNSDEYREAMRSYISLLGKDVKLSKMAKLQMARHLQTILRGPAKFITPEPWLELLERGEVKSSAGNRTSSKPAFFGIESEGERICYVVDMSDSMCKEIDPDAKPKGPITGPRKKRKKKGLALDESDLPWHAINTRWDLAREQLRISLSRLTPDKRFSIVWFGTDAGTLNATKGMVKASKGNIKRAMAELDSINTGPPVPNKAPDGELRGRTNLHSALRVAFGLAGRGVVDDAFYVDKGPLIDGCDTIFLLSDGAPSADGFAVMEKDYGELQQVVDVEYGAKASRQPEALCQGPYAQQPWWLVDDLKRMNTFRRIRMHCVGLGEANVSLLEQMADIGGGEVFVVGRGR